MQQKNIKNNSFIRTSSTIELVQWPSQDTEQANPYIEKVLAIQTTRIAPKSAIVNSKSPYQGFNLGLHVGDCATEVEHNREYLQGLLPAKAQIQWFEQVHGNDVAEITQVSTKPLIADAAVTRSKYAGLAVMTADCLPILLVSKSGDEIAAIHGGWRPLVADVITKTLNKMKTPNSDIFAWLGPCISKKVFEVGNEVKTEFVQQNELYLDAFVKKADGKFLADLHKIAKVQLENQGVTQISALPECTYSTPKKYYSYRKSATTGRMASVICIL